MNCCQSGVVGVSCTGCSSCSTCPSVPAQFLIYPPESESSPCQDQTGSFTSFVADVYQSFKCTNICGTTERYNQAGTVQATSNTIVCNDVTYSDIKLVFHFCSSMLVVQLAIWPNPCGNQCNGFVVGGTGTMSCSTGKKASIRQSIDAQNRPVWCVSVWL